jgi:hypothetical protein
VSLSGNANLTPPNNVEKIAVNSMGSALANFETTSVIAQEFLTSTKNDRSETASATIYEITRHDVNSRTRKRRCNCHIWDKLIRSAGISRLHDCCRSSYVDLAGNTDIILWELDITRHYIFTISKSQGMGERTRTCYDALVKTKKVSWNLPFGNTLRHISSS